MRHDVEARGPSLGSLVPERLFRYLLDLEVEQALRLRYPVALLCLTPDVERTVAARVARRVARIVGSHLRRTDVAAALPQGTVALLLVGAEPCTLGGILDRAADALPPGRPRFAWGRRLVSVSAGGSSYPATAPGAAELLRQARELMRRARSEGGDRLLVPALPVTAGGGA
jgi:GGDEF domain-containing protein